MSNNKHSEDFTSQLQMCLLEMLANGTGNRVDHKHKGLENQVLYKQSSKNKLLCI